MHRFALLLALALVLVTPRAVWGNSPPAITMHVDSGWEGRYAGRGTWVPVHVSIQNHGSTVVHGTLQALDTARLDAAGLVKPFPALYTLPVTLPPLTTKQVALYLPGEEVQGEIDTSLQVGGRQVASSSTYPVSFHNSDVIIGALTSDRAGINWINRAVLPIGHPALVHLSPAELDPVPQALAALDVIVISTFDTSRLTRTVLNALEQYVRSGGSIILIGGPDWQEVLRPLPAGLLPGPIAGARAIAATSALRALSPGIQPIGGSRTTVSVAHVEHGWTQAQVGDVPLITTMPFGHGQIEYVALDPSALPLRPQTARVLGRLITAAAPRASSRLATPEGSSQPSILDPGTGPLAIPSEMGNIPPTSLPLGLAGGMLLLIVLLVGPIALVVARRLRRPEVIWVSVPAAALLAAGLVTGATAAVAQPSATVNTIGVVELGGGGTQAARLYVGVTANRDGPQHLTYSAPALPVSVGQFGSLNNGAGLNDRDVWRMSEGQQTAIDFPSMLAGGSRVVALSTRLTIPGSIESRLHLDASGDITGTIHNGTGFSLLEPAVVAGQSVLRLPSIGPGNIASVRITPTVEVRRHSSLPMLMRIYGQTTLYGAQSVLPREDRVSIRVRNAVSMLPETNTLAAVGSVQLLAWTDHPIAPLTLNGRSPKRRDLTLLTQRLSLAAPHGSFRLLSGTMTPRLIDDVPVRTPAVCCGPQIDSVFLNGGASATFEFQLPPGRYTHVQQLTLQADCVDPLEFEAQYIGIPRHAAQMYDWKGRRWIPIAAHGGEAHIADPTRFVSSTGSMLLRLSVARGALEIAVMDPQHDLQFSGRMVTA